MKKNRENGKIHKNVTRMKGKKWRKEKSGERKYRIKLEIEKEEKKIGERLIKLGNRKRNEREK